MHEDDADLESMLNNPFRNLSTGKAIPRRQAAPPEKAVFPEKAAFNETAKDELQAEWAADAAASRTERNHPIELRVLGLEKDGILAAKRMDDLKRIIEQQNERIQLLEEELDILRTALGKEGK